MGSHRRRRRPCLEFPSPYVPFPSFPKQHTTPQRPYCTLGSLRDQLHYPQKPGARETRPANEDADLLAILDAVNLGDLPVRCVPCLCGGCVRARAVWGIKNRLSGEKGEGVGGWMGTCVQSAVRAYAGSTCDLLPAQPVCLG